MTFLELHNAVLDRLREQRIGAPQVGSDPYYNSIGAHINDAKHQVENAWDWTALRGTNGIFLSPQLYPPIEGFNYKPYEFSDTADRNTVVKNFTYIKGFLGGGGNDPTARRPIKWITRDSMLQRYNPGLNAIQTGDPVEAAIMGVHPPTGNLLVSVYPPAPSGADTILNMDWVKNQVRLVAPEDRLLVPSLPVYSLATALASRERGETGAINTGELFALAQTALSDAIAIDSSYYGGELDYYSDDRLFNTNVGTG